ncbi:MAG: chemotaxis protein CheR, partial [Gammaproteobacteria bacterium]|nr:chemotaxis protein CheR [Gammaproteobacteria bacterium]
VITLVNRAWREFAIANGDPDMKCSSVGSNYLSVCDVGSAVDSVGARTALEGIRAVLDGSRPAFAMEYPCHSPRERRWFSMHVAPIRHPGGGVIVSHINISQWSDTGGED